VVIGHVAVLSGQQAAHGKAVVILPDGSISGRLSPPMVWEVDSSSDHGVVLDVEWKAFYGKAWES
jgi:hypothetical protein